MIRTNILAGISFFRNQSLLAVSIAVFVSIVLFGKIIVNDKPLWCSYRDEFHFLMFSEKPQAGSLMMKDLAEVGAFDYKQLKYDKVSWPIFYIQAHKLEIESEWLPPGRKDVNGKKYLLGSYDLGRDVLSGLYMGLQKALWIGLLSMTLAGSCALFLGGLLSYGAKHRKKISIYSVLLLALMFFTFFYCLSMAVYYREESQIFILSGLLLCIILFALAFNWRNGANQTVWFPDEMLLRYIEIMKSVPSLMVLLLFLQMFPGISLTGLSFIIGFLYIPVVVKYLRWQARQQLEEQYIDAAISSGLPGFGVVQKHMWPKLWRDIAPVLAFGFGQAVLAESTLSFLGLGLPLDQISLGSMMQGARHNPQAWWVILFPGLVVFWLIWTCNKLGHYLATRYHIASVKIDIQE